MHIKMELSFSIFLMLMLSQTARSVPVETSNTEVKDTKPETDDASSQNNPADILTQVNPLENIKKISELFENSVKGNLADAKSQVDKILTEIKPVENNKKLNELLDKLSNQPSHLKQSVKTSTELLQNAFKDDLNEFQAKVGDFLSQMYPSKKNN